MTWWQKSVRRAIECAFLGRCSSSGSRVMCRCVEKCWKRQNDLWWPLITWYLTWPKNWPKSFRYSCWCSFDCRLPRVAIWPRSRVRGLPPARHGNTGHQHGAGKTVQGMLYTSLLDRCQPKWDYLFEYTNKATDNISMLPVIDYLQLTNFVCTNFSRVTSCGRQNLF